MSRKRKRRGRGSASAVDAAQQQEQDHGIEIVDDVSTPGDQEKAQAQEASNADPSVTVESAPADSVSTTAQGQPDHAPDGKASAAISPVHVVESLHESPQTMPDADRNVETLGELLQHAREAKGLSLEEVSARTRINLLTLRHLENDRFGELPAEAYVKGFLRSYGSFLNLDVSMLLRRYEKLSGHVSAPVAEIWDEVDVDRSGLKLWHPSRRTLAISGAVIVVAALAWVFWSQGAVMLGLRPAGELQQIEMQLQREAQGGEAPQTSITGLDDAALQQDPEKTSASEIGASKPPATAGPSTKDPNTPKPTGSIVLTPVEDTAPPVPQPALKPAPVAAAPTSSSSAVVADPQAKKPVVQPQGPPKPEPTEAEKNAAAAAAKKAKPPAATTPTRKPVKKPAPAPSPEDAAGPPA